MRAHNGTGGLSFQRFAVHAAEKVGSPATFGLAVLVVAGWGLSGPLFHYSDTWQLWINTGTTVITFLMVFLIQYTQNRDARAMHLKLDELLRAMRGAHTEMVNLKGLSDEELQKLERAFDRLARIAVVEACGFAAAGGGLLAIAAMVEIKIASSTISPTTGLQ